MKMHDIAKKLKRETVANPVADASPTSPAPSANLKLREHTSPWLLLESLHRGHSEAAEAILKKPGITESERLLLTGIRAAWLEESSSAEQILTRAATQLIGVYKCWAHLTLATLFLDTGNEDAVDYHISRARRYAYEDRQDKQCLSVMVELLDARADIDRGAHERASRTLNGLLADCSDPYLHGYACYLLGCLGRFREDSGSERIEILERAYQIFEQEEPDRYLHALVGHELSYCDIELTRAAKLAESAARALKELHRMREARVAESHATELNQRLAAARQPKVEPGAQVSEQRVDRVGQCLFISAPMRAIRIKLDAIAAAERDPVLILGPRGCGKEMLAQSIHMLSPRRNGPMLAINCGALPDQLIESELFGYEKGAFTGAQNAKRGLFELANDGTLFLDEIGELTLPAQTKLLRVLQTGNFRRLGATTELNTNARIVAATNRDLDDMASSGTFRDDLLDRLSVWRLRIPPLTRRREEILPLAEEFLTRYGDGAFTLDQSAKKYLLEKDYPGNVRILENDIRRSIGNARAANTTLINATMICEDFDFETEFTSTNPASISKGNGGATKGRTLSIEDIPNYDAAMLDFERELLIRALAACQWNKKLAGSALGMSERTFWRAIQRHKLHTRPEDTE